VFLVEDKQENDSGQAEKSAPCKDDFELDKSIQDGEEPTNALNRRSLSLVKCRFGIYDHIQHMYCICLEFTILFS
jgi:hypothetical protein